MAATGKYSVTVKDNGNQSNKAIQILRPAQIIDVANANSWNIRHW